MILWKTLLIAGVMYITGVLIGRRIEKNKILHGVIGVLAEINKSNKDVESVTYYYSEQAYDLKVKELKENGEEYYE